MSVLQPVITQLCQSAEGLSETLFEPKDELLCFVLCDAVYLNNPEQNAQISKNFEKIIRQYLQIHQKELNEKVLKKAIEHAQNYFYKNYIPTENQLKVSAVIVAEVAEPSHRRKVLIAGLGDIKVYHLDASIQLIYYDPELPQLPESMNSKKRFNYLSNAIGCREIQCGYTFSELYPNSSLVITTYGGYYPTNKEKIFSLFHDFQSKKNQVHKLIQKSRDKDHLKSYSLITFSKPKILKDINSDDRLDHFDQVHKTKVQKKERYIPLWALKVALVALVCLICLEFFNYYLSFSKTNPFDFSSKVTPKEVQTNITLRSLKRPLEFPFLKERAYIVDLKEKYERQNDVIAKLQKIISDQDKALRNLQVKSYYQPNTISAKAFRTEKKVLSEGLEDEIDSSND